MPTAKRTNQRAQPPENLTIRLLQALHVHPASIDELTDAPADRVAAAIAYAQVTPGIASVAGWVVDTLRKQRDAGWPSQTPQTISIRTQPIDAALYTSGADGDLFRLGSDIADLDAPIDNQNATPAAQYVSLPHDEQLSHTVRAALRSRCIRAYRPVIQALEVRIIGHRTVVYCRSVSERLDVLVSLLGALRCIVAELALPEDIVVTDGCPAVDGSLGPSMPGDTLDV
jgi:hypothetical protein